MDTSVIVPRIEVLAAFRQSALTARREGFFRTADAVDEIVHEIEALPDTAKLRIEIV